MHMCTHISVNNVSVTRVYSECTTLSRGCLASEECFALFRGSVAGLSGSVAVFRGCFAGFARIRTGIITCIADVSQVFHGVSHLCRTVNPYRDLAARRSPGTVVTYQLPKATKHGTRRQDA